jgi:aminotransferase
VKDLISSKVNSIPPSGIRRFFDMIAQMDDVISLGVGEPDFITPWHIREAAVYYIEQGYTSYTSNAGMLQLRKAVANRLEDEYNIVYSPEDEIIITVGVSEALDLALRAVINPGDEVIIPEPCYVSYKPCTILAGGVPVEVPTTSETEFKITPEKIEAVITPRTKVILLSYPSNPTGTVMNKDELMGIAEIVKKYNLLVISDEIYSLLTYDKPYTSFASLPDMKNVTILLDGLSKAYAMTGWRIGYAAAHKDIIHAMCKIHQYSMLCAPIIAQLAGIEALNNGDKQVQAMKKEYNRRRKVIVDGFNKIGLSCHMPHGAFYAFPCIKNIGLSSEEFAEKLLLREKVAVVPGNVFGECGEGYIRCSYATSMEDIEEALRRIDRFVKDIENSL